MMEWSNFNFVIDLEMFDVNSFLRGCGKEMPTVLDVGCGMSYATGNKMAVCGKELPLDMHYVDPLAAAFNRILRKRKVALPKIEPGMVEYLSSFFPSSSYDVDLIIIQNALDHSAMPVKGIIEAIATLRMGGVLYLNHHPNEAETEKYKGFHQYNIINEGENLVIWNKKGKWIINDIVAEFADVTVNVHDNGHVIAVITKKGNVPAALLRHKEDLKTLCEATALNSDSLFGMKECLTDNCKYLFYNTLQFFVQAMPWHIKMKLKKLIKR